MSEDNFSVGKWKTLAVLADVTNQLGKRGISSILGNLSKKSGDGNCENIDKKEREKLGDTCALVDDKEKSKRACVSPRPCSEINSLRGNVVSGISRIRSENKNPSFIDFGVGSAVDQGAIQAGDDTRASSEAGISRPVSLTGNDSMNVEVTCDSDEGRVSSGGSQHDDTHVSQNEGDDHGADNLILSQTGSVDYTRLPESQESRCFGLERCTGLKADGCSTLGTDVDLIRDCSCSFCTKAAYVWLDLHYQDMKGRIAALKKSQKDASILVERSCRSNGTEKHGEGISDKPSKLEYDLMTQWKSLFLHMEDIFGYEGNQLETSLLSLKELRERCKRELEEVNGIGTSSEIP